MGKGKNLISRATTLLDSNVQFLTTKKIKHTNKQESMTHSNEKKIKNQQKLSLKKT